MRIPTKVILNKTKNLLTIVFDNTDYQLSSEYLRVNSPSAEVVGHSINDRILQLNKQNVTITTIKAVGNYAIILNFSDGHNTGIYSWEHLYDISINKEQIWKKYLLELKVAGHKYTKN